LPTVEYTLGVPLLDRHPHGIEPTLYGRALIKRSIVVFDELRQSVHDITGRLTLPRGLVPHNGSALCHSGAVDPQGRLPGPSAAPASIEAGRFRVWRNSTPPLPAQACRRSRRTCRASTTSPPGSTSPAIIVLLAQEVARVLSEPAVVATADASANPPSEFAAFTRREADRPVSRISGEAKCSMSSSAVTSQGSLSMRPQSGFDHISETTSHHRTDGST
jgi:hypothetical protein